MFALFNHDVKNVDRIFGDNMRSFEFDVELDLVYLVLRRHVVSIGVRRCAWLNFSFRIKLPRGF